MAGHIRPGDTWGRRLAGIVTSLLCVLCPGQLCAQELASPPAITGSAANPASDDRPRALACMTAAIAYEAGFEPVEGKQAVGEVILNRLRSPLFPKSVCGVVFAGAERSTGCQFSFTCDGSLHRQMSDPVMAAARTVAEAVLDGAAPDRVSGATHYHADYVSPYWAPSLVRVTKIGAHIFYRLPGIGDIVPAHSPFVATVAEPAVAALDRFANRAGRAVAARVTPAVVPQVFAPWGLMVLPVASR